MNDSSKRNPIDSICDEFKSRLESTIDSDGGIAGSFSADHPLATADPLESFDPEMTTPQPPPDTSGRCGGIAGMQRGTNDLCGPVADCEGTKEVIPDVPQHADDPTTRYRPTAIHARGGLGAVFRARDQELNRLVALKEILPEHSTNPRYQEKFVFEAEVTGALEHPGIVPVYGLGRYRDNQPYYAMRFIRGRSFSKLIREFHKKNRHLKASHFLERDFRALLRRLIETCNAIHFAHEHGVLHRDIKPANVMIGDYGETLVVDWGLAKLIDPDDGPMKDHGEATKIDIRGRGSSVTREGSIAGTPMYMSPEQAHAENESLDGRTDIYSLGAVLFHLVTGKNPIDGKTSIDVIRNVRDGNTQSMNSVVPSAPRPLASICRKAMAFQPSDRYETAVALADDIDRWLNDEAVVAHVSRETVFERAGRLIRRYRSWTISGTIALLMITAIAVVAGLVVNQARKQEQHAKQQERLAKVEAIESKQEAVRRYRDSRNAIDTWLVQTADAMQFFPGAQAVRKRLLQRAIEDYERLAQRQSPDPLLTLERGRALVRLGDLTLMQQDFHSAQRHYATAMQVFREGLGVENVNAEFQAEIANVHLRIGNAYAEQKNVPEAEREFRIAIDQLTALAEQTQSLSPRRLLATANVNVGKLHTGSDSVRAIKFLTEGLEQYNLLDDLHDETVQLGRATAQDLLGQIYRDSGDHSQAMKCFDDSIRALQQLVADQPDHPDFLNALASAYVSRAASFRTRGLDAATFESLTRAVDFYRALRNALPGLPRYALNLAIAQTALGLAQHEAVMNVEADQTLNEAYRSLNDLVRTYGQSSRILEALANCQDARGQVRLDLSQNPGDTLRIAQDILLQLSQTATTDDELIRLFEQLAIVQSHLAQAYQQQNQIDRSKQKFDEAIQRLESLIEIQGAAPRLVNALAHAHYRTGLMLHEQNDPDAESQFRIARDHWVDITEGPAASYAASLAWLLATCPLHSINDPVEARRYAEQAVELAPENARYHTILALAAVLEGDPDEATRLLQRSKTLRGNWIDRDLYVRALAEYLDGNLDKAEQAFEEADAWREEHRPFEAETIRMREIVRSEIAG